MPGLVAVRCHRRLPGERCRPRVRLPVARLPRPERALVRLPVPWPDGAVHADPVARAIADDASVRDLRGWSWGPPTMSSARCLAAPHLGLPLGSVRRSGRPAARRTRLPGCSSLRNSWLLIPPEPLSPRGSGPFSCSSGPRAPFARLGLSTPVGVRSPVRDTHSRTQNPRSRGILELTGLSTELSHNPQNSPVLHRAITTMSTARGPFIPSSRSARTALRLTKRLAAG